jgi:hypothetical protein
MGIAGDLALILVAAFLGGLVARRLGLPLIWATSWPVS